MRRSDVPLSPGARLVPGPSDKLERVRWGQAPVPFDCPDRGPPAPKPYSVLVTLKSLSTFTVTMLPSDFCTCASYRRALRVRFDPDDRAARHRGKRCPPHLVGSAIGEERFAGPWPSFAGSVLPFPAGPTSRPTGSTWRSARRQGACPPGSHRRRARRRRGRPRRNRLRRYPRRRVRSGVP